jgi:CheY-like chemotaxis protein
MPSKKTILVVDDIPLMRTMLVKYIKTLGMKILKESYGIPSIEVVEAQNGKVALEKMREHSVDLIFLDLMMPEMDGLTFLGIKRESPELSRIPVIVCSALGEKDTVDKARDLGARSYIMKPFTLKTIEENLREAMEMVKE